MHGTALQPAGTQDAHGRRPAGRGFRELEPDLLPALFPHAGRPPEPGGVSLAGTPRPLQGRPARTAGAAGRRSHVLRGFGAADALSARRVHARLGARLRIPGGQIRHRTAGCRGLGTGRDTPRQPSRTASGTGGRVLHTGRIRNGTRHVMPHGRGYPAAVLHRSVGLLAHAPHPGDRKRRTISSASTSFPSCNTPTAASPGAKRCATAPSRCSNACQPRTTVTCATGATRAL